MEIEIIISEPWDFSSSDGYNIIRAKVVKENDEYIIGLVLSKYLNASEYLLLKKRDVFGNYNIYAVDNIVNIETEKLQLFMIGKVMNRM